MDRADIAKILGIAPSSENYSHRGGGRLGRSSIFQCSHSCSVGRIGNSTDQSAWFTRVPESIISTTKRHPARMRLSAAQPATENLQPLDFTADFNTGAYSSWGPTVAAAFQCMPRVLSCPHYRAR